MRIIAVVVDYNRHDDTLECLSSLQASLPEDSEIVVVDNGSDQPLVVDGIPHVQLLRADENGGFARGYNLGIRRALAEGADAVLILNNDTIVERGMIAALTAALCPGVGIVAPRIYYAGDPVRIWSDGFFANPLTLEMRLGRRGHVDRGEPAFPRRVDYVTGCAMLVPRGVFAKVGLFDETYFAYYEDLEFCRRVRGAGFAIVNVPAARLWHKVARTTSLGSPVRERLLARGSVVFFARHAGWRWPTVLAARSAHSVKFAALALLKGRTDLVAAHVLGLVEGFRDVRQG